MINKKLINVGAEAACTTDTADVFGDSSGVALYTLDYDASDASGDYDGTPTNVEFGVGGQINYGARFNGSSSYVQLTSDVVPDGNGDDFSISCYVRFHQIANDNKIIGRGNASSGGNSYGLTFAQYDTGRVYVSRGNGTSATAYTQTNQNAISVDTWHHLVCTYNGTTGATKIYVDKIDQTLSQSTLPTGAVVFNATYDSGWYALGQRAGNGLAPAWLDGDLDQVRIFSSVLNQTQVNTLFAETACEYTCTTDTVNHPTTNVAYYKLDNDATDEVGSYDGTETDIEYRFGRFGQAAVFNGSSSKIDISATSTTPFDASQENFTISLWVNVSSFGDSDVFISKWGSSDSNRAYWLGLQTSSGDISKIAIYERSGSTSYTFNGSTSLTTNTWHHIVYVRNATQILLYIDNSAETFSATNSINQGGTENVTIGQYSSVSASTLNGKIDQVRIFSSALNSTQVTQLYEEKPCADTSTFKAVLYTGNSSTQYISNVGFEPDLVWIKSRTVGYHHRLFDSVRGLSTDGILYSNLTDAADNLPTVNDNFVSFDANGFTLGATSSSDNGSNKSGANFVAWCWKAGGDAVNDSLTGDIPADISANQDAGFSIVKYTGNQTANQTVPHGLSSAPEFIVTKGISGTDPITNWKVYNSTIGNTKYLHLNSTLDATTAAVWNDTSPTSSVFSLGSSADNNGSGTVFIAYCFHSVSGVSKVGSYSGVTGSKTVYVTDDDTSTGDGGFEPQFIMIKKTNSSTNSDWYIFDNKRGNNTLYANENYSEDTRSGVLTYNSDGFTITGNTIYAINNSGDTYIYIAFA